MQTFQTDYSDQLINVKWKDLNWYKGTQLKTTIDQKKAGLRSDYDKLSIDISGFGDRFKYYEYTQAYLTV